jgi:hypothetical protein
MKTELVSSQLNVLKTDLKRIVLWPWFLRQIETDDEARSVNWILFELSFLYWAAQTANFL